MEAGDLAVDFSEELIERIREVKRTALAIHTQNRQVLVGNLLFLHDAMVASERLLVEAAEAASRLPESPFSLRLFKYYREHVEEERGHAGWLRDDLVSNGVCLQSPDEFAMAMIGTQYYMFKHVHPAALLGYLAVVEGDPTPKDVVDQLEILHGPTLLRCVRFHSTTDLEHRKDLFEIINLLPHDLRAIVCRSSDIVLNYYVRAASTWG